jgi:hypothetical protein
MAAAAPLLEQSGAAGEHGVSVHDALHAQAFASAARR